MDFIIGGAYQGKLDYALEKYKLSTDDVFECTENAEIDSSKKVFYHFERYLLYCFRNAKSPILDFSDDQIVIMDDIFCGVVPTDAEIRGWREFCGRTGAALTKKASSVTRIFCGLPQVLKEQKRTFMVYTIRHGRTTSNEQMLYCGQTDVGLSDGGIEELKEKKSTLKYPDVKDLDIYTSCLKRTEQTLFYLFGEIEHVRLPGLNEINFGDFDNKSYEMLKDDPAFIEWCSGNNDANIPPGEGAESGLQMRKRVSNAFDRILSNRKDCLIVSHGGPITSIYQRYFPNTVKNWYELQPANGEGYLFEFDKETLECVGCKKIPE